MVLDEDALEAMLKRQEQRADDDAKQSKQVELTDATEDFEVYERPSDEPATGAGIRTPRTPSGTAELPEAFRDDADPDPPSQQEPAPEPAVPDAPPPEPAPEPVADTAPEPVREAPPAAPTAEPAPTSVAEETAPERPRVWPPLSSAKDGAPTPAPQTVEEPEPAPEPEPDDTEDGPQDDEEEHTPMVDDAPTQEPVDPHAHAHAEVDVDGGGTRIAIVQALFNQDITDMMADLAVAKAKKRGATITHHALVPGVYDLPLITKRLLLQDDVDCAVVIGVVIQGETAHDGLITHATAQTLQQVSLDTGKPIGFGVTGPGMTWKQAEARVANAAHAVDAALAQVELIRNA